MAVRFGRRAWTIGIALVGCTRPRNRVPDENGARPPQVPAPLLRLAEAEDRRAAGEVTEEDLGNHDVAVRRRAARALARIGGTPSLAPLLTALSDEDPEVVAWAAYGLGYACRTDAGSAGEVTRALATRAASIPSAAGALLDPEFAVTRALGRCATDEAEKLLETWLSGPPPRRAYAALALGDVASKRKALAESTELALLAEAASAVSRPPLGEALHPFGRLEHSLATTTDRLFEVAASRLSEPGPTRIFAIRALSRTGKVAAPPLGRVLAQTDSFAPSERAEAARGLGRLGEAGQHALGEALVSILPQRDALPPILGTAGYGPLLLALQALTQPDLPHVKKLLYELATLPVPAEGPVTFTRRAVAVRCRAASLLVNGLAEDPLLLRCDPEEGGAVGQRAQLDVIGRRPVRGRRLTLFRSLASSPHKRVREAAIELMGAHPEIPDAPAVIAAALGGRDAGIVATAAEFVAAHPNRVAEKDAAADVGDKLVQALGRAFAPDDIETIGALIEAAGAAGLAKALPTLEAYCGHANPTLREHASRALSLLKSTKANCNAASMQSKVASELARPVTSEVMLDLGTDSGTLSIALDPRVAPVAVTRIFDLAREGFYDGIVVHRVVAGFVVQFGDPGGDGFGGPGREPLRCETTPLPFERLSVGVALAGRDTGSSQLFVTLARNPHLDGEYALVGKAAGDWDAVAEGDVIGHVKVSSGDGGPPSAAPPVPEN